MPLHLEEIGRRLRAYRLGRNLTADEVAERIGISRAAVYRLEKGCLVKIETLERLSELLDAPLPSLMGVGVEYYSNAVAFFERMRQIEETASFVTGNFSPISLLLLSDDYLGHLRTMLVEFRVAYPALPACACRRPVPSCLRFGGWPGSDGPRRRNCLRLRCR